MTKPNGVLLYRGPSEINGEPIIAIATGFRRRSDNAKTGDMIQTWILAERENPVEAATRGHDVSICGGCSRRPDTVKVRAARVDDGLIVLTPAVKPCYVKKAQAPLSVWRAYERGQYSPPAEPAIAQGRQVRIGSYGDPAAVPFEIWERLLRGTIGHTGYTHAWRRADPRFATIVQASCDFPWEYGKAFAKGYGIFAPIPKGTEPPKGMAQCPASKEAGHVKSCATCGACSGTLSMYGRKDIYIIEH